jgi:lipoate-protein ligase A
MNIHDDLYKKITTKTSFLFELWQPEEVVVVLGRSQTADKEVNLLNCLKDKVPVLKRRGGGGAVVLMPGVLCFTIAFLSDLSISPYFFFKKINQFIVDELESAFQVDSLSHEGISDIAIGTRKILGCSILKSRSLFFYQGSLLVDPDPEKISRYLRHPTKEPDYRAGRSHADFITSLRQSGYPISLEHLKRHFEKSIPAKLVNIVQGNP